MRYLIITIAIRGEIRGETITSFKVFYRKFQEQVSSNKMGRRIIYHTVKPLDLLSWISHSWSRKQKVSGSNSTVGKNFFILLFAVFGPFWSSKPMQLKSTMTYTELIPCFRKRFTRKNGYRLKWYLTDMFRFTRDTSWNDRNRWRSWSIRGSLKWTLSNV